MLTELRRTLPTVRALSGSAEVIPLPDASVDAVLAGNAMHWFDMAVAGPEIARVLAPGGKARRDGRHAPSEDGCGRPVRLAGAGRVPARAAPHRRLSRRDHRDARGGDRRRKKAPPPMDKTSLVLAVRQQGLCPLCKQALIVGAEYEPDSPREWINWFAASKKMLHKHHFTYRRDGGADERTNLRLVHSECHRQHHAGDGKRTT